MTDMIEKVITYQEKEYLIRFVNYHSQRSGYYNYHWVVGLYEMKMVKKGFFRKKLVPKWVRIYQNGCDYPKDIEKASKDVLKKHFDEIKQRKEMQEYDRARKQSIEEWNGIIKDL